VLVVVSGVVQDPSTYGVVGNTLTFSAAPPSGTGNISCRYLGIPVTGVTTTAYRTKTEFTATAGQTTFTPPSYTVGYIDVFLNGVLLGSADYTASNGTTVVLAAGAAAGALVTTESFYVSSVLNAIPNAPGAVSSSNLAGGAALTNIGAGGISSSYLASSLSLTTPTLVTPTITNNLTFGTSNAGIVFNKSGALTNSTLNDYEEGTWTPTDGSGAGLTLSVTSATYIRVGKLVTIQVYLAYPVTSSGATATISGLPYIVGGGNNYYFNVARMQNWSAFGGVQLNSGTNGFYIFSGPTSTNTNAQVSGAYFLTSVTYITA
jgi:hypothetical protein